MIGFVGPAFAPIGLRLAALAIDAAFLAALLVATMQGVNAAIGLTFNTPWRAEIPVRTHVEVASRQTVRDSEGTVRDTTVMRETRQFADGTIRVYAVATARFTALDGRIDTSLVENVIGRTLGDILRSIWTLLLSVFLTFAYFALMEGSPIQATIGKRALGLKVTDSNGCRLGLARSAFRQLMKAAELLTSGLTYLIAAFTPRRQALHDIFAGTLVLRAGPCAVPARGFAL
jgi:uncharacterized RDD family membrane protein YckC